MVYGAFEMGGSIDDSMGVPFVFAPRTHAFWPIVMTLAVPAVLLLIYGPEVHWAKST